MFTIVLSVIVLPSTVAAQTTVYVDENANLTPHDGSSWCNAYLTLDEALAVSTSGFTIRVADGTYTPDETGLADPREATYTIVSGIGLEGGYAGCGASDPDARDYQLYETILTGERGDPGDIDDNCYSVLTVSSCNLQTTIDGFTFTRGKSSSSVYIPDGTGIHIVGGEPSISNCIIRDNFGNAVYCENSNLRIEDCLFEDNIYFALYVYYSTPTIKDCVFQNNLQGCMENRQSTTTIEDTVFDGNSGGYGGAIKNYYSTLTVSDCDFTNNTECPGGGGAIHNFESDFNAVRCDFAGNETCTYGGAFNGGIIDIEDCTFTNNTSLGGPGGAIAYASGITEGSTFTGNEARSGGGAIGFGGSISGCFFENNSVNNCMEGGGAALLSGADTINDSIFRTNSADYGGAVSVISGRQAVNLKNISNCRFVSNTANQKGGVIYALNTTECTLYNSLLLNNTAVTAGGAIAIEDTQFKIVGCTISGSQASQGGVAVSIADDFYSSQLYVYNSILWNNSASTDPQISVASPSTVEVAHCCVQGGFTGIGNILANPQFADVDLRLNGTSPCIEAGDNDLMVSTSTVDLDGNPRIAGCFVDMGAYEYLAVIVEPGDVPGDANADCIVDVNDYDEFSGCLDAPSPDAECLTVFDWDDDGDIDLADYAQYQQLLE